jgi:RecJ-like exonuclease
MSEESFFKRLAAAASRIEGAGRSALVVSHYDADGLAAASILARALAQLGFTLHIVILEQLTHAGFARIEKLAPSYPLIVLVDMGSGALLELSKLKTEVVVVLDHHSPGSPVGNVEEVNPHRFGIDGSKEVSSSGLAYLLAKELKGEEAVALAPLAVVGALGDRQDVGRGFKLIGINRRIVEEGVEAGLLEERTDIRVFGGSSRPLVKALAYTIDPFLPGITGDEGGAFAFLKDVGIEPTAGGRLRTLSELGREERKRLASALVKLLLGAGYSVREAERVYGATYILTREPQDSPLRDAREFAQLLNAAGRMGYFELAVALGMGARGEMLLKATDVAGQYRSLLAKAFKCVREENIVKEKETCAVIDFRGKDFLNERVSGALASLLLPYVKGDKILLVLVDSPEGVKVSARRKESPAVHVGELMAKAAGQVGGVGGGHESAGGATVPTDKIDAFIDFIEKDLRLSGGSKQNS